MSKNSKSWDRVQKLGHGKVYVEVNRLYLRRIVARKSDEPLQGNLANLIEMTNWQGNDVLYIGDHIYGDLAVSAFL